MKQTLTQWRFHKHDSNKVGKHTLPLNILRSQFFNISKIEYWYCKVFINIQVNINNVYKILRNGESRIVNKYPSYLPGNLSYLPGNLWYDIWSRKLLLSEEGSYYYRLKFVNLIFLYLYEELFFSKKINIV